MQNRKSSKSRREKHRIVARVDKEFHEQVVQYSKLLGLKIQEVVMQALQMEMQGYDLRKQLKQLQNRFDAVKEQKERAIAERKTLQLELKEIALWLGVPSTAKHRKQTIKELKRDLQKATDKQSELTSELKKISVKLGVPDTAAHCIQRIGEIEQELQTTADKLSIVEGDRDAETALKKSYKENRDDFKRKHEEATSELRVVEAKLEAYQQQGFWERVFGRVPESRIANRG